MWKLIGKEIKGIQYGKCWYENDSGKRALFKPMTENKIKIELAYYEVCVHLGISCTKVEAAEFEGVTGILSYDIGKSRFLFLEGEEIKTGDKIKTGISFRELSVNMSEKEQTKFADMVFADTLLQNSDRHSENFKLRVSSSGKIIGLLDLFDHDQAFMFEDPDDYYLFRWDTDVEWESFERAIKLAYRDFPDRINNLVCKTKELPKDIYSYGFIMERLKWIESMIYENKDKKNKTGAP